jgi:hypothetical protein
MNTSFEFLYSFNQGGADGRDWVLRQMQIEKRNEEWTEGHDEE